MQDKKSSMSVICIPTEMLVEAGITANAVLEMYVDNGAIVIHKVEDVGGYVCDLDCENCPFCSTECEDNCEECPCREHCEYYEYYIKGEDN